MAIVQFQRNGQGFFDFDALLNATSVEFVERVKVCVDLYEKHGVEFEFKVSFGAIPSVYFYQKDRVRVFRFYKTGTFGDVMLLKDELLEMVGGFNG